VEVMITNGVGVGDSGKAGAALQAVAANKAKKSIEYMDGGNGSRFTA